MGKVIGLIALIIIIGAGAYLWSNQAKNSLENGADSAIDKARDAKEAVEQKGAISSLKEAMGLGEAMHCTYAMEQNGKSYESEITLQGERFRSATKMDGVTMYALHDGTAQYTWTSKDKQGFKFEKACLDEMQDAFKDLPQATTGGQQMAEDAKDTLDFAKSVQCSPAASIDLSVPADITFTDQCAMMRQSLEAMKQLQQKMPQGMMGQ
ncbi:MAG: hypothetical protein A2808_03800 [Candidatus Moranbacteria bacterium RIFCSPHIGHO2_01_FULL_55_24]|nr:MAG: hypothetical protein A2808_03800 [Candidatus Moranbacteria bacterium RIFCSPHIGHO2_01_FULL_55_24]